MSSKCWYRPLQVSWQGRFNRVVHMQTHHLQCSLHPPAFTLTTKAKAISMSGASSVPQLIILALHFEFHFLVSRITTCG